MTERYCLALDLKDDAALIAEYERQHERLWPEITESIRAAGIVDMEIYRTGNRLLMVVEAADGFSFDAKSAADEANTKVQEWETLMDTFQQRLPWAARGEKWVRMARIFKLQ